MSRLEGRGSEGGGTAPSPPWHVGKPSLRDDLDKVAQQWAPVRRLLEDEGSFMVRDAKLSAWSCGEHAGHVAIVNRWIALGIEGNLREPERGRDESVTSERVGAILDSGLIPRGRGRSPESADPAGRPRAGLLSVLIEAEECWNALAAKVDEIASCPARFPHHALGHLTSGEWVRFCAVHTAHHLSIVQDIRSGGR